MNGSGWIVLAALAAGPANVAAAPGAAPESVERDRIARERADVQATFAKQEADCQTRFVVTPCVDAARKAEREALARLRRQEVLLDEQARRQRAAERTAAIRSSVSADEARRREEAAAASGAAAPVRVERAELVDSPGPAERPRRELPIDAPASAAARQALEQQNIERNEAQRRAIQAHRESVEERNAKRAASTKPPAAPLPVPSGAAP